MIYKCSGPRFDALRNPYTGEPMRPVMSVSRGGRVLFFAPGTYSPSDPYPTARDAFRAWNRVDGVEGLKDGRPLVCAYTGRPLRLVHDGRGYHYEGGYDAHVMFDRGTFLHFATMRDGVSQYERPAGPEPRVDRPPARGEVTAGMRRHCEESRTELSDEAVATAEAILQKHRADVQASSTVSMSGGRSGRKSGRRGS